MLPRSTPFQPKQCSEFGLEIISHDKNGNPTVRCKFYAFEGRDKVKIVEGGTRKRKSRGDIKYFTKSFMPLNYRSHLQGQHKESWEAYQQMSNSAREACLQGKINIANTL
ncbi:hypothetical protein MPTK1_2g00190 [Marchantia polymorpha subsp. ruderalis]|uniref:Uncharacterized protein n=1 Tax=Marchantia polymorpha TaxID=3197 RepID=A0A2R6X9R0_MARPO|nr:hypothetical protein MARPO_0028s0132 [Marchantia polymorpha]BBN00557.1 hypothetical protein Mp_2g00190 [Marchantia polymorpha subsp. ruderalis]|eukprot:PTQ42840.1 hypothetical protein MARPO_0028s0132 [Marchantia polymorpha]